MVLDLVRQVGDRDMESADVLARVVASSPTAGDGRHWNDLGGRRNDGSVGAVLENDAVTILIIGVVCLEGRSVEGVILSSITNSASLLLLLADSDTIGVLLLLLLALSALRLATVSSLTSVVTSTTFSTPVIPPRLVDITSGSFATNLEIAAVCNHNRCRRSNVT